MPILTHLKRTNTTGHPKVTGSSITMKTQNYMIIYATPAKYCPVRARICLILEKFICNSTYFILTNSFGISGKNVSHSKLLSIHVT